MSDAVRGREASELRAAGTDASGTPQASLMWRGDAKRASCAPQAQMSLARPKGVLLFP